MSSTEKLVTLPRLVSLIEAYGADADRWPEEERAAALALMDSSAKARSLFDEARALDDLLDRVEAPAVSPALARRVRSIRSPASGNRLSGLFTAMVEWLHPGSRAAWQGAVAAAAVVGVALGIGLSAFIFEQRTPAPVAKVAATHEPALPLAETATTESAPVDRSVVPYEPPASDTGLTMTTSLAPDIAQISLTGDDGTSGGSLVPADDSEMATASIPLY